MSRRWRYPRSRRGSFTGVFPQAAPPPVAVRARRRPVAALRRGRFFAAVPAPVVVAPTRPPDSLGHDRIRPAVVRRGRFFPAPASTTAVLPTTARAGSRLTLPARRGRFLTVVPAPAVVAPTRTPDSIQHNHVRAALARRGRFLSVPAPPAVPSPPPWIPPYAASRRPLCRPARRGRFATVPPGQPVPASLARRRTPTPPPRRGHRNDPPWAVTPVTPARPPDRLTSRRRAVPAVRRHRYTEPPWPQATPPVPPPAIPAMVRTRRRLAVARRGCFWRWSIFQATQPVVTDLPSDLSAMEAVRGRVTAAETALGSLTAAGAAQGRIAAAEAPTNRISSTEHRTGDIEA